MNEEIPRSEHLAWCKTRALAYVDAGDLAGAFTSMLSDMRKHPETALGDSEPYLFGIGVMEVQSGDAQRVRHFIEGFN